MPGRPSRAPAITTPPAASSASSFQPCSASPVAAKPTSSVSGPLTAAIPSFQRAWATMAMMTGPTPYITQPSCGVSPKRT